jgi:hypothetical protein
MNEGHLGVSNEDVVTLLEESAEVAGVEETGDTGDAELVEKIAREAVGAQGDLTVDEQRELLGNETQSFEDESKFIEQRSVPDAVTCHWKLVETKLSMEADLAIKNKAADEATAAFEAVHQRNITATNQIADLAEIAAADQEKLDAAQSKYKGLHQQALKMFYTAKGDLDGYNNERKKVDLDAAQSQQMLKTYLKYKKQYIEAAADVEDADSSEEVQHYKKLSSQYLARYHKAQNAIKQSYSAAKSHQTTYFELSKEYHDLSEDANAVASKVEALADAVNKTHTQVSVMEAEHKKDLKVMPGLMQTKNDKEDERAAAQAKFDAAVEKAKVSKYKFFKLSAIAEHLKKIADDSAAQSQRDQLRHLDFMSQSDDKATQVEAATKSAMMMQRKYEAANATVAVYQNSFEFANCDRVLAEDEREGMKTSEDKPEDGKSTRDEAKLEMCKSDKSVADANQEASTTAKTQHMEELNHLAMLRKEHEEAVAGATAAAKMRDAAQAKAERLTKIAAAVQTNADSPCS